MEINSTSSNVFNKNMAGVVLRQDSEIQEQESAEKICHDAVLLTEALRAAQNAPDVRAEKVAALRASVLAGTYDVDVKAVAKALIRDDFELL